ncbi:MAG: hypothetical protein ABW073_06980 [Acidimicrobiia bacterium]
MSGVPEPVPEPQPEPLPSMNDASNTARAPAGDTCPLCATPIAPSDMRCPRCNRSLAGVGNRPGPFSRRDVVLWAGTILVIYLAVMLIVFAAR